MGKREYTFRDYLRDRGEEDLLKPDEEPELSALVLREVKLAACAFLALVVAVVLVFYEPEREERPGTSLLPEAPPSPSPSRSVTPPRSRLSAPPARPAPAATGTPRARSVAPAPASVVSSLSGVRGQRSPASRRNEPAPRAYVVRSGDTLEGISRRFYGTGRYWRLIARYNGIEDPRQLRAGRRLLLPEAAELAGIR